MIISIAQNEIYLYKFLGKLHLLLQIIIKETFESISKGLIVELKENEFCSPTIFILVMSQR